MLTAQWKNFRRVQDSHLVPLFSEQECVSHSVLSEVAHVPQKPEQYGIVTSRAIGICSNLVYPLHPICQGHLSPLSA